MANDAIVGGTVPDLCCVLFRFLSFPFVSFRFVVVAADTQECVVAVCAINLALKNPKRVVADFPTAR